MKVLQPPDWARPRGYANGIAAHGTFVTISGQIGWNANGQFESDQFLDQVRQALSNLIAVLAEAGGKPEHIVRMTWYVLDRDEYLGAGAELGRVYRSLMGAHYPAMTAVVVAGLIETRARVEIEATAVLPD